MELDRVVKEKYECGSILITHFDNLGLLGFRCDGQFQESLQMNTPLQV